MFCPAGHSHKYFWEEPPGIVIKQHRFDLEEDIFSIKFISWNSTVNAIHMELRFLFNAIKNWNRNRSVNEFKKLGYERCLIYKQLRRDSDLCGDSFARFNQIYRALYGDAMLVPNNRGTNTNKQTCSITKWGTLLGLNVAKRQVIRGSYIRWYTTGEWIILFWKMINLIRFTNRAESKNLIIFASLNP